jgi:predicted small metal-binding protein
MKFLAEKYLYEDETGVLQDSPVFSFRCRDIGINCSFETSGAARHKVLRTFIEHAESSHNLPVLSAELLLKFQQVVGE